MSEKEERYSTPLDAELVKDEQEKAHREARNALRQFDAVIEQVEYWTQPDRPFRLRPSTILNLHRIALEGITLMQETSDLPASQSQAANITRRGRILSPS